MLQHTTVDGVLLAHDAIPRTTDQGLFARDYFVITTCLQIGVPVACVVGGGYDTDKNVLAKRHATVFTAAFKAWKDLGDKQLHWR